MTEAQIFDALSARYCAPEYALIPQATQGTGWKASRWLDAVAVSLWPSRGITFHGFEIKSSRGDWRRELANPEKAEGLFKHLDLFSVVAASPGIVADGELPPAWGLIVWDAEKQALRTKVAAPRLHDGELPRQMSREFLAGICRRIDEQYIRRKVEEAAREAVRRAEKDAEDRVRLKLSRSFEGGEEDRLALAAFAEGMGYRGRVPAWDAKRLGEIAAKLKDVTQKHGGVDQLRRMLKDLDKTLRQIDALLTVDEPNEAAS